MSASPTSLPSSLQRFLTRSFCVCWLAIVGITGCDKPASSNNGSGIISVAPTPVPSTMPATNPPATAPTPVPAPVAAEPNSFDEVAAQLDRGGSFYAYVSTEKFLAGMAAQFGTMRDLILASPGVGGVQDAKSSEALFKMVTNLYTHSGVDQVTGAGASTFAVEPGLYRSKLFIHHRAGKGDGPFWSAFGKTAHPLAGLDLLPADTALAGFADFDLAEIVAFLRREIEQSEIPEAKKGLDEALKEFPAAAGMTLDEALSSLGGSLGFIVTLDPTKPMELPVPERKLSIPTPRAALLVQVKDDRIFKRLDQILGANKDVVKVDEGDLRLRTLPSPMPPPLELHPTVAQWGGYLILATDDHLVRAIIAAKTSGKGLKSTAQYAKMTSGLPTEGNGFQLMTETFGETLARVQREMLKGQPGANAEQFAMLEKFMGSQKSGATYSVSAHLPNGWLAVSKGTQGVGQLLAPSVLIPAAIGAGVALPVFGKVGGKAKATKSLSNARQIGTACKLYAVDNGGKFPKSLAALVPDYLPDATILASPFAPGVAAGYTYHAGLTDTSPAKTVLIEDKFAGAEKTRVIVRVDGSGEILPAP
ncbi:MAG: hypothetical protein K8R23_01075 [Chthoniobacter sp.]|nr:hypothetical protein [Chthoniobacter sp.]